MVSDAKITAVVPKEGADIADPGDNGAATLAVIIDRGTGTPSSSNHLPFTYQLHVASITPNAAPPRGGTPLTITGTGFGPAGSTDEVDFFPTIGGHVYPLSDIKVVSDAKITAVVPKEGADIADPGDNGAATLRVIIDLGVGFGSPASNRVPFTYQLHVTSITPNTAAPRGGTPVTITGSGFGPAGSTDEVDFFPTIGGHVYPLSDIKVVSDSRITAVVPKEGADIADPGDNGAATLRVIIDLGVGFGSPASNRVPFTYQLHVTSITPNTAAPRGGTPVTITGSGFGPAGSTDEVDFFPTIGGHVYPLSDIKVVSDSRITAVVPKEGADIVKDGGAATVRVIIDLGVGFGTPASNRVPFTYG